MASSKATWIAAGIAVLAVIFSPDAAGVPGSEHAIVELPSEAVARKILDNGLTLFARESPPQGLVAIDVKILAGSSLEGEYLGSGISHLVEHMVFKGTKTRGPGEIEREIKSYGGIINGSTSNDITSYYILLPADRLPQGLAVVGAMLVNAAFDDEELRKEREVVLKEINLNEDEPQSRLMKRLDETAYLRHPYKYPAIGYAERFKRLTRDDLVKYYDSMYVPNRMVVSIVGGVDPASALSQAETAFRDLRTPNYSPVGPLPAEPVQLDTRSLTEDSRTNLAYLAMGFHSTAILDEDLFALDVLAMILGRGDNSRLNTSLLKEKKLVYSVEAWNNTPKDPGLFVISAILDKASAERAETAVMDEIARLGKEGATDNELDTARRMVLADYIGSLETVDAQANSIGLNYMLTGSPEFSRRYVDGIQMVSKEDIRRVAKRYLKDSNMTVVRFVPKPAAPEPSVRKAAPETAVVKKDTLPNGLTVVLRKESKAPTVSITAAMRGGVMVETEADNGLSNLASQMLLKGTPSRSEDKIQGFIEGRGGSMNAFSDISSFGVKVDILKNDIEPALDILADVLANSVFPPEELEKEKRLIAADIVEEDSDIFATGFNNLRREVFGDSPYGLRYRGESRSVASLDRDNLIAFYKAYVVPGNMVLSVSGDIDPEGTLAMIRKKFAGLPRKEVKMPSAGGQRLLKSRARQVLMDKEQSLVLFGFETVAAQNDDRYALEVLGSALSGSSGRLFESLRNRLGLAYALGCAQKIGMGRGYFAFYIATTKDNIAPAKKALLEEIAKVRQDGITDKELVLAKNELRVSRQVARQTNGFYSLTAALDELYDLGYGNMDRYDERIGQVTKEDVRAVAQKYLDPGSCAEVTVSSPS